MQITISGQDHKLLNLVEQLASALGLSVSKKDADTDISEDSLSIEQYNRELNEAMERIDRGEFTNIEDLEKEIKIW